MWKHGKTSHCVHNCYNPNMFAKHECSLNHVIYAKEQNQIFKELTALPKKTHALFANEKLVSKHITYAKRLN